MEKTEIEFIARFTTKDGRVVERKLSTGDLIPFSESDLSSLDSFLDAFDKIEDPIVNARDQIGKEIMQAWVEEQAKKGGYFKKSR